MDRRRSSRSRRGSERARGNRSSSRRTRRGRGQKDELFHELNDLFVDCIERDLADARGIFSHEDAENINIALFTNLASKSDSQRDQEIIISNESRRNGDGDFALKFRLEIDRGGRSRRTSVQRRNVKGRSRGLDDVMNQLSSGTSSLDENKEITPTYIKTYLTIEDGIEEFILILGDEGYLDDPEVVSWINSGEIRYEFGGLIIMPTVKVGSRGKFNYTLVYETSPIIKMSIKDDFSFKESRSRSRNRRSSR